MAFNDLTAEQQEMVRGKSPDEIFELAKKLGRKLTDEEVEQIAGGETWGGGACPQCGSGNTVAVNNATPHQCVCHACGYMWWSN